MNKLSFQLLVHANRERKPLLERVTYVSDLLEIDLVSVVKAMQCLYDKSATITLVFHGI